MSDSGKKLEFNMDPLFFQNLGKVVFLWGRSQLHKDWPIHLISQYVRPALERKQYLILEDLQGQPLAYISWACLGIESEVKYLENPHSIEPNEWNSGDRVWFMDLISPYGQEFTNEIIKRLRSTIFSNIVARSLRVKPGENKSKVAFYSGIQVTKERRRVLLDYYYKTAKESSKAQKIVWDRE